MANAHRSKLNDLLGRFWFINFFFYWYITPTRVNNWPSPPASLFYKIIFFIYFSWIYYFAFIYSYCKAANFIAFIKLFPIIKKWKLSSLPKYEIDLILLLLLHLDRKYKIWFGPEFKLAIRNYIFSLLISSSLGSSFRK